MTIPLDLVEIITQGNLILHEDVILKKITK